MATDPGNPYKQRASGHEGIIYRCDECEYVATRVINLKNHKESKHEGIRYPCDNVTT